MTIIDDIISSFIAISEKIFVSKDCFGKAKFPTTFFVRVSILVSTLLILSSNIDKQRFKNSLSSTYRFPILTSISHLITLSSVLIANTAVEKSFIDNDSLDEFKHNTFIITTESAVYSFHSFKKFKLSFLILYLSSYEQ